MAQRADWCAAFINSKLTPLFIGASLALGTLAVVALPREEEPQIIVPMVDVLVAMPGASSADVEQRVTRPLEQLLWEVPGVEYVSSTSSPGRTTPPVRVDVDPSRLAAYELDPLAVQRAIAVSNAQDTASGPVGAGQIVGLEAGTRLKTADDVRRVVVRSPGGRTVAVGDVADVSDGDAEPTSYA